MNSTTCVRVGNGVNDWFPIRVDLRQGCVMSSWLFNVYMDVIVREVNARRMLGRGLSMVKADGRDWNLRKFHISSLAKSALMKLGVLCRLRQFFSPSQMLTL